MAAPLPDALLQSGLQGQRYRSREEWLRRRESSEVPDDEPPPDGPDGLSPLVLGLVAGSVAFAVLGAILQGIISGVGGLLGTRPGPLGWAAGLAAGIGTGFCVAWRLDRKRERDVGILDAHQRTITDPGDCGDMAGAQHHAAVIGEIWPLLPQSDEMEAVLESRLRGALWRLASGLLERRTYAGALAELRSAGRGAPAGSAARDLAAQTQQAHALHEQTEADVRDRIGRLSALATQCRQFRDEQNAVERAREVTRTMAPVLGMVQSASQPHPGGAGELTERAAAVLSAYRDLARDVPGDIESPAAGRRLG